MERYLRGVHNKFGHLPTWLPGEALRLGDIGELVEGRFVLRTTLANLRIRFTKRSGKTRTHLDHSSGSDVSVDFNVSANDQLGGAGGRAAVTFGARGAFIFQALDCVTDSIEDMAHVSDEVIIAYRTKEFRESWLIVDRLVSAQSATILICNSSNAKVEFSADCPLSEMASLADATISLRAQRREGEITQLVARSQLTPMFGASQLSVSFLGKTRVDPFRNSAPLSNPPDTSRDEHLSSLSIEDWVKHCEDANA